MELSLASLAFQSRYLLPEPRGLEGFSLPIGEAAGECLRVCFVLATLFWGADEYLVKLNGGSEQSFRLRCSFLPASREFAFEIPSCNHQAPTAAVADSSEGCQRGTSSHRTN